MDIILIPLLQIIMLVLNAYAWIVIIAVIMDWLFIFKVLNPTNRYIFLARMFMRRVTEPVYARIRRVIPPLGNIDFSPLILLLAIYFSEGVLVRIVFKLS